MANVEKLTQLFQLAHPSAVIEGLIEKGSQINFEHFLNAAHPSVAHPWPRPSLIEWAFEQQKTADLPIRYAALNFLLAVALDPHYAGHMTRDHVSQLITVIARVLEGNHHHTAWWGSAYESDLMKLRQAHPELANEGASAKTAMLFFKQNPQDRENSIQPVV